MSVLNLNTGPQAPDKYQEIFEFLHQADAELIHISTGYNGAHSTLALTFLFGGVYEGELGIES